MFPVFIRTCVFEWLRLDVYKKSLLSMSMTCIICPYPWLNTNTVDLRWFNPLPDDKISALHKLEEFDNCHRLCFAASLKMTYAVVKGGYIHLHDALHQAGFEIINHFPSDKF